MTTRATILARAALALALVIPAPLPGQTRAPIYQDRNGSSQGATGVYLVPAPAGEAPIRSDGVLTREEARVLDGFGYTVSTTIVAVSSGNFLNAQLTNPAGSGVTFVMTSRTLACNIVGGQAPSEYARYATGATLPGTPTSVTIGNRRAGGTPSTGTFQFSMGAAAMTGTVSSSGFIPTNGERLEIKPVVLVPPGATLNYSIGGAGGGLAAAARCVMTFLFYTVPA